MLRVTSTEISLDLEVYLDVFRAHRCVSVTRPVIFLPVLCKRLKYREYKITFVVVFFGITILF